MKTDYSIFIENVDSKEYSFSNLPVMEQMNLIADTFPIGCVVNITNILDYEALSNIQLESEYQIVGYVIRNQPYGFNRLLNVIIFPVEKEYTHMSFKFKDDDLISLHPGSIEHNKKWLRKNKIDNLLD